jgi:uncharacterized protein (UPF0276 family)
MRFAVNYSAPAYALIESGAIDTDMLKCSSDFPDLIPLSRKLKPVCIHFSFHAGRPTHEKYDKKMIEHMLKISDTRYVNMHLSATNEDYPEIDVESQKKEDRERVIEKMIVDVTEMTDLFGSDKVILENFPYHARARSKKDILRVVVETETINRVIEETGCGLLLDIDHARTAALAMGEDPKTYIGALPVNRIKELHMTGTKMNNGVLESHLAMKEDDWEFFDWTLGKIARKEWSEPDIMAFEYGGVGKAFEVRSDPKVIRTQVPLFMQKITSANARLTGK